VSNKSADTPLQNARLYELLTIFNTFYEMLDCAFAKKRKHSVCTSLFAKYSSAFEILRLSVLE
jgi:hypothetical protein